MNNKLILMTVLSAAVLSSCLIVASLGAQTTGQTPTRATEPPDDDLGPGRGAPWSVEGTPKTGPGRPEVDDRAGFPSAGRKREKWPERSSKKLVCELLEVEELGRLYVQDTSGTAPYWIQLPKEVKIRTSKPDSFGGRKVLELDDLEAGQKLMVSLRKKDGEIIRVQVYPPKVKSEESYQVSSL